MALRLGGWHRLWILFSSIYLIVVIVGSIFFFKDEKSNLKNQKCFKIIEQVYFYLKKEKINDVIVKLEKVLNTKDPKALKSAELFLHGISLRKTSKTLFVNIENADSKGEWEVVNTEIEYPIETPTNVVCSSLKEFLIEAIKKPDLIDLRKIRYESYRDLTDDEIISKGYKKYGSVIDFSTIDKEFENKSKNFLYRFFLIAFAVWIVPVVVIYILGLSTGWIIRGFRGK